MKMGEDMRKVFRKIEHDIRTQYLVAYGSAAKRRSAFHTVQVRTKRGRVQTASGFFYPAEALGETSSTAARTSSRHASIRS